MILNLRRGPLADQALWAVLAVWALLWAGWAVYLDRYGSPLPWCDEYAFCAAGLTGGAKPLTLGWLWEPANEHRLPLTKLWVVLLGRLFAWDFRAMHQANFAALALGCLALILAVRRARGRSWLADAFLPLLVLTPAQYATLVQYVYAYGMALGLWCLAAAAVLVGWPSRSVPRLLAYLLVILAVCWAGGPAGNLWALGFCAVLARGWVEKQSRVWNACAMVGGVAVVASSAVLIIGRPPSPTSLKPFVSDSWLLTLKAASEFSVAWMGQPLLQVLWPWALAVLLVPGTYLLGRLLNDFRRPAWADAAGQWLDLTGILLAAAGVTVVMGYGRARFPLKWDSRYATLVLPIAAAIYLMLVRCRAPRALPGCLTLGMAVCVGWNWPAALAGGETLKAHRLALIHGLRQGDRPLSLLAEHYADATGWAPAWGLQNLVEWWAGLRTAGVSAFRKVHHTAGDPASRCLLLHADSGRLAGSLHALPDSHAVAGRAVQAEPDGAAPTAIYEVQIPTEGRYRLCCRWSAPRPGEPFRVAVDDGPSFSQAATAASEYTACVLEPPLSLAAGGHRLTVTWPGPGARLDVLELTPE